MYEYVQEKAHMDPTMYQMFPIPSIFCRGNDLASHIDVIMHFFYLDVVKTVAKLIQSYLQRRSKFAAFLEAVDGRLESVNLYSSGGARSYRTRKES